MFSYDFIWLHITRDQRYCLACGNFMSEINFGGFFGLFKNVNFKNYRLKKGVKFVKILTDKFYKSKLHENISVGNPVLQSLSARNLRVKASMPHDDLKTGLLNRSARLPRCYCTAHRDCMPLPALHGER